MTNIGDGAFEGCKALTSIEIPNSVKSIGNEAFSECEALTSIEIPNSVTSIGESTFSGCKALTNIEIPNLVASIGDYAFSGCKALTNIKIPNYVTRIGDRAFLECEALTKIKIGCSVNLWSYNEDVWWYGHNERTITIGFSEHVGLTTCKKLTDIEIAEGITTIGHKAFYECKALTNIEIPDSVTSIGEQAFKGCEALTKIEIPNSVTSIGEQAFKGCEALTSIDVTESNANYASIDGVLYDKEKRTLIQCPGGKTNIEIPNSVTSIGDCAFLECEALTSIEIPNSVTRIGDLAFFGCKALTSIHIRCEHPEDLKINEDAFGILFHKTNIENCTLYVPIGTGYAYRHHPVFSKFKEVVIEK